MEKFMATKDNKRMGIRKGEEYVVKRTIMGDCVLITDENAPNIIAFESTLGRYGILSGTPYVEGVGEVLGMVG